MRLVVPLPESSPAEPGAISLNTFLGPHFAVPPHRPGPVPLPSTEYIFQTLVEAQKSSARDAKRTKHTQSMKRPRTPKSLKKLVANNLPWASGP